MATLADPIRKIISDRTAKVLGSGLGLHTVGDLVRHYPRRYAERGELTDLSSLRIDEHVTVLASVASVRKHRMRAKRGDILQVTVTDGRGYLELTFFRQSWRERELRVGRVGLFAGKVGRYRGRRQLTHPDYQLFPDTDETPDVSAALDATEAFVNAIIPVYPATAALTSWNIAKCVRVALDSLDPADPPDPLPAEIRRRHRLLSLRDAMVQIHRPETRAEIRAATHRLKWDEAFVLQVELARRRAELARLAATPRPVRAGGIRDAFDARLPYSLTGGQRAVSAEIEADLAREHPMHRLLQGEVGSGKTLVALRAMLAVVDTGGQAVLLAPTEVLAQQHYRSITDLLGPLAQAGQLGGADQATRVALLTGSQSSARRRQALLDTASGDAGIVIGTHALLEDPVQFFDLGLVVVDEQHRFGVEQRAKLTGKADKPPHLLVMTATPIPRTVAMTVFGDLDVSTLTELPAGRVPIATHVVPAVEKPAHLERTWQRLREEVAAGHQAYVVCPRIGAGADREDADEPEVADPEPAVSSDAELEFDADVELAAATPRRPPLAVLDVAPALTEGPLHGLRVAVLHGRLPADAKDDVMRSFTAGEIDVLVATTVIEVGVDVANATAMVVMDADRFGVAQLHQIRGRVGRGSAAGLCLLVTESAADSPARARLAAIAASTDGFEMSKLDLEHRREGDVLGAAQSGHRSSLRLLSVLRDEDLIKAARDEAAALVGSDPDLVDHPALAEALADMIDPDRAEFLEKA
ncbi:MAG TPA: ATP-dependent DNA helicase RecG [Actinomycetes bacterium]|nr:ATP-dependent DNA helicase RecG [Actinomycetes bacterium]